MLVFLILNSLEIGCSQLYNNLLTVNPTQTGTITVTGYWWYWYNTTHLLPITKARVDIYDEETTSVVHLGSTETDYNGYFTFGPVSNNDGPGEDGLDIFVIVNTNSSVASVVTSDWSLYSAQTPTFDNRSDDLFSMGNIFTPYSQRGAWWIFSYHFGLTRGWHYLLNTVGYNTPTVICRWPYGDYARYWTNGTIDLADWVCWWPDMILHEYGHHVMYSLYEYIPPSMLNHSVTKQSNSTTAWAEGWANFFPLVVFNDPIFVLGINATHGIPYNLETPHWCSEGWDDGDEVEGRVAGALWDIFDSQDDGYDAFDGSFTHMWNIMNTTQCDTFHEFWDAWVALNHTGTPGYPKSTTLMAIFQNSIDYREPGDVCGPPGSDGPPDYKVDMRDIRFASSRFGAVKGQPGPEYDQRGDVNYDDKIDMKDIRFIADLFGAVYEDC